VRELLCAGRDVAYSVPKNFIPASKNFLVEEKHCHVPASPSRPDYALPRTEDCQGRGGGVGFAGGFSVPDLGVFVAFSLLWWVFGFLFGFVACLVDFFFFFFSFRLSGTCLPSLLTDCSPSQDVPLLQVKELPPLAEVPPSLPAASLYFQLPGFISAPR